ncbi:biopolymer transporter ExbD [Sphingomonas gilva]|uniref:Biopolymer transporter ExbD n=1 Tax=Sphingomonas gilva TaxID=2305907 RepID=A0A396RPC4_9SPHN|nr:biopolymer transporter ExbD [Sphingomonas gilva]RHW18308.1 biopolymer transporter ExbD [Sphingomonas gilva]
MRRFVPAAREPQMFAEMNTTPLIDVMLVLLVMVIITIPIMNHEVPVELPQPAPGPIELRVTHRLEIAANGAVSLDGRPVADAALPARLAAIRDDPNAELTVRTDEAARYDRFAQTMAAIRRAGITRLGFVGHRAMLD